MAPEIQECPTLRGPVLVDNRYVYFYCEFTQSVAFGDVYRVRFLFNNEPGDDVPQQLIAPSVTESNVSTSFALHERHLTGRLNSWVSDDVFRVRCR